MNTRRGFLSGLTRRPSVCAVAFFGAVVQCAGCYVTDRYRLPIPFNLTDPMTVQWADQEATLIHPRMEGDSMLVGLVERPGPHSNPQGVIPDTVEVRIPASALYATHRRFNPVRTALAAALFVPIGVVGIWAMAWAFASG